MYINHCVYNTHIYKDSQPLAVRTHYPGFAEPRVLFFWSSTYMRTAILIDGGFIVQRFRKVWASQAYDGKRAANWICSYAKRHLTDRKPNLNHSQKPKSDHAQHETFHDLYRIFFYDCPPLEKKFHNPLTQKSVDYSKTDEAVFRNQLHTELKRQRKVALRLGHLGGSEQWMLKPTALNDILKKKRTIEQIDENEVFVDIRQKGVDMRIGVDIASLSFKKQVDQIVLIAGDSDFVPAAKLARREGIDFILDPLFSPKIDDRLNEHIDGVMTKLGAKEKEKLIKKIHTNTPPAPPTQNDKKKD